MEGDSETVSCCNCIFKRRVSSAKPKKIPSDIIHLLIIGTGDVGKSTIIKQMKNLACTKTNEYKMYDEMWKRINPFSEDERKSHTLLVHQNILIIIGTLIMKVREYRYDFDSDRNRMHADELMKLIGDIDSIFTRNVRLNPDLADVISAIWGDSGIQTAYDKRCCYLLSDSTQYFLDRQKLIQVSSIQYVPSNDDILRARDTTQGAKDYNFKIGTTKFSITDLGGQPVERQRLPFRIACWLNRCEQNGSTRNFILYVASLADYNQKLIEHPENTKLDESIKVLMIIMGIEDLCNTGFILFLNKSDIFREKLKTFNDFSDYFEEYIPHKYKKNSVRNRIDYQEMAEQCVVQMFREAIFGTIRRDDALYCRITCATDTEGMNAIISAVQMAILNGIIKSDNMP